MNKQLLIAIPLAIVFVIIGAVLVTGGNIDIPGLSHNMAEIHYTATRGTFEDTNIWIKNVDVRRGLQIVSIRPLLFPMSFRVEAIARYGGEVIGSQVHSIQIDWWSGYDGIIRVGIGEYEHGVDVEIRLWYLDGTLRNTDTYTIP